LASSASRSFSFSTCRQASGWWVGGQHCGRVGARAAQAGAAAANSVPPTYPSACLPPPAHPAALPTAPTCLSRAARLATLSSSYSRPRASLSWSKEARSPPEAFRSSRNRNCSACSSGKEGRGRGRQRG
jgi:hypothetical protein